VAEFEDEDAGLVAVGREGAEEGFFEKAVVEEGGIGKSGECTVTRMDGPVRDGDLFGDFEAPLEDRWRLAEEFDPEGVDGELIEGKVAADGEEDGGVFAEAGVFEEFLRKFAARLIARARVDLTEPAFVFPGAAADINATLREGVKPVAERVAVEFRRFF
jgi:hypothetical protein